MNLQLRRASEHDALSIRSLTRAAYAKWIPLIGREPLPMKADYQLAVRDHLIDLLEVDAELAGLVELVPKPEWVLIENLAVAPAFQGRGLAKLLLARADDVAASLRSRGLLLYTNKLFRSNIELYLWHGFTVDREEAFMGGVTVYMSKSRPG